MTAESGLHSRLATSNVKVVVQWVEALHGQGEIAEVLRELVGLVGAKSALLARLVNHDQAKRIAAADVTAGKLPSPPPPQSCSKLVLRENLRTARPGSIWRMSDVCFLPGFDTAAIHDRGLRDVVVLVLGQKTDEVDVLEFHFHNDPRDHDANLLSILGPEFSNTWVRRTPGCVQHAMAHLRLVKDGAARGAILPILHPNNPSGLSRSEYRICVMIGDGMKVKTIAEALSVCETTVRSHLTSIFSKTNTSGQVELIHRLMEPSSQTNHLAISS